MSNTPAQFFSKNLKWITLIIFVLFLFKSVQSCNRNTLLSLDKKQYIEIIDSLKMLEKESQDSIKKLNFELKLFEEKNKSLSVQVGDANKRADDAKEIASKVKSNTTVVVKAEEIKDTSKK